MANRHIDGRTVEMTPQEEAEFIASQPGLSTIVPQQITRRQCAKRMKQLGMITGGEAVWMVKQGEMPAMVTALVAQLPAEDRDDAELDFAADTYLRSNPLLVGLMTAAGKTSAEIDDFFRTAAEL